MSDELADAVQSEDQGGVGTGGDPPYAEYLSRIPEDARDDIEPIFKEWDQNVSKKFQEHAEFRKQWEPLQDTGISQLAPEQASWAVQFLDALDKPELIQGWFENYAKENGLTPAEAQAQVEEAVDDFGFQDPSQQYEKLLEERLGPLMKKLEEYDGRFQQQTQAQQMAHAEQVIEGQFAELEKEYNEGKKFDDEQKQLVHLFAGKYIESDWNNAIPRGYADLQHLLNNHEKKTLQGKLGQPAPAESGGVPDVSPPEHKRIDDPAVKNAALEWMRNQNRA